MMEITVTFDHEGVGPFWQHARKQIVLAYLIAADGNVASAAAMMGVEAQSLHTTIRRLGMRPLLKRIRKDRVPAGWKRFIQYDSTKPAFAPEAER